MKSSRRGFLGLIAGGATAGPGALKKAIAQSSVIDLPSNIPPVSLSTATDTSDWRACEILQLMKPARGPVTFNQHEQVFSDIACLKSISNGHKCRMNKQKQREYELAHNLGEFLKDKKLNWIGLSEENFMSIIKKAAGE